MAASAFVYVTYIRTSPDELWSALIGPEFTKKYWFGFHPESDLEGRLVMEACSPRWSDC